MSLVCLCEDMQQTSYLGPTYMTAFRTNYSTPLYYCSLLSINLNRIKLQITDLLMLCCGVCQQLFFQTLCINNNKKNYFSKMESQYLAGYHYKCSGMARSAIKFVPISTLYSLEIHRP